MFQHRQQIVWCVVLLCLPIVAACKGAKQGKDGEGAGAEVERLPDVKPNLPPVPKLPPPKYPVQYDDKSYSVLGLRKRLRQTMDKDVSVTAHVIGMYEAPECPRRKTCPKPVVPHFWLADEAGEQDVSKRLTVTGYADSEDEVKRAMARAKKGQYEFSSPGSGQAGVPTDCLEAGAKVKVRGRFTRVSATGFNIPDGLVEMQQCERL
ncbi:MAG: hypothetical protein ACPGUV_07545 [Polyangiales bacterium]